MRPESLPIQGRRTRRVVGEAQTSGSNLIGLGPVTFRPACIIVQVVTGAKPNVMSATSRLSAYLGRSAQVFRTNAVKSTSSLLEDTNV